jgi:hypothetical protein
MSTETNTDNTVRYAPYLENLHWQVLNNFNEYGADYTLMQAFNAALNSSPYTNVAAVDVDEGFFGLRVDDPTTTYEIKNFPSLWDMFGKFMAGQDIHDLWADIYEDVLHGPELADSVTAQSALLQDEINTNVLPKFLAGMRDINSVQSTTFVVGKAIIADSHVKAINKFSTDIRLRALDHSVSMFIKHLDWNSTVISTYAEMYKLYYSASMDITRDNLEFQVKDAMWKLNLFDPVRTMLGALSGSAASVNKAEPSPLQKALGGALSGAAAGNAIAPGGTGALMGGIVGAALGFL